ncbi:MAG: RT0821/Lpp0805 family surface protein [Burkholderiales bacterium]
MPIRLRTLFLLIVMSASLLPSPGWADPPAHAPAHGWRKKHDPYYIGYAGKKWPKDYGVLVGRCNYAAVGAVLGGVVGGAIGSQVGQGEGRAVAIVVGTVLGAVLGAQIGRDLDEADRACIGHTLELAPPGRRVVWVNPNTGVEYAVVPTRNFRLEGRDCREFTTERILEGRRVVTRGTACRDGTGTWQLM